MDCYSLNASNFLLKPQNSKGMELVALLVDFGAVLLVYPSSLKEFLVRNVVMSPKIIIIRNGMMKCYAKGFCNDFKHGTETSSDLNYRFYPQI